MQRSLPLAAALLSLATLPALADTGEILARLDTNGDKAISRAEFIDLRATMFARIDADASGTVTRAEIEAAQAAAGGSAAADDRVWQQDTNGDGQLTLAEYTSQTRGFDRADRNKDGYLTGAELDRIARALGSWLAASGN
jgi:Ca2+-binding EF-hand superfamily protein